MSEAKQRCQLDGCSRAGSTRCFCCRKNVCTRHFTEHIEVVKSQIDPLANEINTMVQKIQGLTIEQITDASFAGLHQWGIDMHQLIDETFLAKTKETEDLIEKNKSKFDEHKKQQSEITLKIQDDVGQLVENGEATFGQIRFLKNLLASVETNLISFQQDFLSVSTRIFSQGLVTISSNFNKPPVLQHTTSTQPPPQNFREFLSVAI